MATYFEIGSEGDPVHKPRQSRMARFDSNLHEGSPEDIAKKLVAAAHQEYPDLWDDAIDTFGSSHDTEYDRALHITDAISHLYKHEFTGDEWEEVTYEIEDIVFDEITNGSMPGKYDL